MSDDTRVTALYWAFVVVVIIATILLAYAMLMKASRDKYAHKVHQQDGSIRMDAENFKSLRAERDKLRDQLDLAVAALKPGVADFILQQAKREASYRREKIGAPGRHVDTCGGPRCRRQRDKYGRTYPSDNV